MKFLIVDDHAVVREGVAAVLRQGSPGAMVLQAHDVAAALSLADEHLDIDVVFLDLMLPGVSGSDGLDAFGRRHAGLPVMVLSSSESPADVRRALARGALGYVPKSANAATLLAALNLVLAGEVYVPPLLAAAGTDPVLLDGDDGARDRRAGLTERQTEVLSLIGAELPNKEIAYRLGLSEKTVKAHITAIFRTLRISNRAQAGRVARGETSAAPEGR